MKKKEVEEIKREKQQEEEEIKREKQQEEEEIKKQEEEEIKREKQQEEEEKNNVHVNVVVCESETNLILTCREHICEQRILGTDNPTFLSIQ